ncbi:MAG: DUF4397 domain-containing protein [Woeseiaceae bacterium]
MKRHLILAILVAALVLGACAKETSLPDATGKGSVRLVNAIPGSSEFAILIEERLIGTAGYKGTTGRTEYDDLSYTFNFETILAGDTTRSRVASQFVDVQADVDYSFVLSGAIDAPDVAVWENAQREWGGSDTVFEVRVGHLATTLGQVDVYIADEATPPALGSQIATIGIGEVSATADLESGDYVVTVTPAGDDTTILFVSAPVTITAQNQILLNLYDADGNDLSPYSMRLYNTGVGGAAALVDSRYPAQIRFIHASINFGDADIYTDDLEADPTATPIVTNHTFMDITPFLDIASGTVPITYTAPGDTGSILIDIDESIFQGTRNDFYVYTNLSGTDVRTTNIADRRSILTSARFSIFNTVSNRDNVDFYLIPTGENIEDYSPFLPSYPPGGSPLQLPILPNSYDIYITVTGETTVLAGPIAWDAVAGDVVESIIFENVDPNIVDFVFLPAP